MKIVADKENESKVPAHGASKNVHFKQDVGSITDELNSDDMHRVVQLLNAKRRPINESGQMISPMQSTECGTWRRNRFMPRFVALEVDNPLFVQILNVGDHWITVTNVFGKSTHDLYVYDSLYADQDVKLSTIVQVSTSLLPINAHTCPLLSATDLEILKYNLSKKCSSACAQNNYHWSL